MERFEHLGIIKNDLNVVNDKLIHFENKVQAMGAIGSWSKQEIVDLFYSMIPDFGHKETGKYLDAKM